MDSSSDSSIAPHSAVPVGRDQFWAFGEKLVANDTNRIKCKYCKQTMNGGITRFKHHLAGRKGNVKPCPQVPADVKSKAELTLKRTLERKKAKTTRLQTNLDEVAIGVQDEEDDSTHMSLYPGLGTKRPIDQFAQLTAESSTIKYKYKKNAREDALSSIASWVYEAGIPFDAVCCSSFQQVLHFVGLCGGDMKAPTPYELEEKFLQMEVEQAKEIFDTFTQTCKLNGCSLMIDVWTDQRGRNIINIMVHCISGVVYWLSKNVLSSIHDGKFLFDFVDEIIDSPNGPGEDSIVQIVTDNTSTSTTASGLMDLKRSRIFWTSCATHTLNLLLQDIANLNQIRNAISLGRQLTAFIYSYTTSLNMFRESTKELDSHDLVRPGVTKFATAFLSLQSILEMKRQLRGMFISAKWESTKLAQTTAGKKAADIVFNAKFWANVELAIAIFAPLVRVLRRAGGDAPSMGWLYGDIKKAREEVAVALEHKKNKYLPIWKLIDYRWESKLSSPLHLAGYYFNPYFYYPNKVEIEMETKYMSSFVDCLTRLYQNDPVTQDQICIELDMYQYQKGLFGKDLAKRQMLDPTFNPVHWWKLNGIEAPHLRSMAMRILSLTTSSSGCERNWSTFEMIYSKKRNRLNNKRLSDLVFVNFNAMLKSKYSDTSRDPIAAKSLDTGKVTEWMVGAVDGDDDNDSDDEVFPREGLTWAQLGDVIDVDLGTRKTSTSATNKTITGKSIGKQEVPERDTKSNLVLSTSSDEEILVRSMFPSLDDYETDQE